MSDIVQVFDEYAEFIEDCSDTSVVGCDGSFCGNEADTQTAYPLDDMPNIVFCQLCWTQEMNRRKRTGKGNVLPFPGHGIEEDHTPLLRYPGFDSTDYTFEKIRRSGRLEE